MSHNSRSDKVRILPDVPEKKQKGLGRPTVMTPETISKIEEVWSLDGSDNEACLFAGITAQTLQNYYQSHPEYRERRAVLKESLILASRQNLKKDILENENIETSKWYLARKKKDEFSERKEVTGADGDNLELKVAIERALAKVEESKKDLIKSS